ncbi:macro domain-containing protein [Bacillus mycoides]|uniref:Appr-1-p processing protein n=1 Tax=Bacillus mycoides TaxID=1405 RepID=A0A4U2ZY08_BACMY|nr:macro domain-containing protein [Bacillus mycoides]TKI79818.1 Appr-1-p processing protein [Bacillus mycoides]
MRIFIKSGDITTYQNKVDVIVNAWNKNFVPRFLLGTSGVSKAIFKKSGREPYKELKRKGLLKLGEAVITSPGTLKCKALIHVAGINTFWKATDYSIRKSTSNTLKLLIKQKYRSVAIPLIGSGSGGYEKEECLKLIKDECKKFNHHNIDVYIISY